MTGTTIFNIERRGDLPFTGSVPVISQSTAASFRASTLEDDLQPTTYWIPEGFYAGDTQELKQRLLRLYGATHYAIYDPDEAIDSAYSLLAQRHSRFKIARITLAGVWNFGENRYDFEAVRPVEKGAYFDRVQCFLEPMHETDFRN